MDRVFKGFCDRGGIAITVDAKLANLQGKSNVTQPRIRKSVLENGVRVITHPMDSVRSTSMAVLIDAGPRQEEVGEYGLAHLCEHLIFQGTSSRDAMEIARIMDGSGGQVGAFTAKDYTCYYAKTLDDYLPYALDLLGDVLLNSIFPPEHVDREKNAILCEIESRHDNPELQADQLLKTKMWPGHSLGRPLCGEAASIAKLDREDIIYFVHRHYLPGRIIIAAAGKLDHEDFVAQVRDAFWRLAGEGEQSAEPEVVTHGGAVVERRSLSQAYFCLGIPAPQYDHSDRFDLHILNKVLGAGISSRLFRRLREETGLVYSINSEIQAYRDAGVWVIEGSTIPDNMIHVLEAIREEFVGLLEGTHSADFEELPRARRQIEARYLLDSEDTYTCMSRLATQELYFGRQQDDEEILAQIRAVTGKSLAKRANQVLENLREVGPALAIIAPEHDGVPHEDVFSGWLEDFVRP